MNTANLQLEGLLLAVRALHRKLVERNILTRHEIDDVLRDAAIATGDGQSDGAPTTINQDVIQFPIRMLRLGNATTDVDRLPSFQELARAVGETTPAHRRAAEDAT